MAGGGHCHHDSKLENDRRDDVMQKDTTEKLLHHLEELMGKVGKEELLKILQETVSAASARTRASWSTSSPSPPVRPPPDEALPACCQTDHCEEDLCQCGITFPFPCIGYQFPVNCAAESFGFPCQCTLGCPRACLPCSSHPYSP